MAKIFTSTLAVELLDRVTGPARGASAALARLGSSYSDVSSPRLRLDAAMARNEAALGRARAGLVDAVAGAYALKSAFSGTTGAAMALEDKMADIAKVSDMSDAQLKAFEGSLRRMARGEIPLAVEELADLAAAASQSGISDNDLEAFTRQVAKSAVAWDVSGQYAGESLAKIKTALGMTIPETARYADAINYLSDTTAASAPDLVEFARRVAADGKVAGFSNEEVLTLGASMVSMGAEADVAATSLRNAQKALTRGASATKRQDAAFKKLGLHADDVAKAMPNDAMGQFLDVLERIKGLDQHEQIATMSDLFGDEARALMPLLGQLDQLRDNVRATADETNYLGSVQKEFETRSKTGRYALQRFNNQVRDVGISVGQSLLPAMKQLLEAASPTILAFADWAQQNPKLVASVAAVTAGLVGLRVALAGLRFIGLLGKGGALALLSGAMSTVGAAGARLFGAARGAIALQTALGAMGGQSLGTLGKIGVGLRAMLGAIPGMRTLGLLIGKVSAAVLGLGRAIPGVSQLTRAFGGVGRAIAAVLRSIGLIGPTMAKAAAATEAATARMSKAINKVKFSGVLLGATALSMAANAPKDPAQVGEYRKQNDQSLESTARNTPGVGALMRGYEGAYRWVHGEAPPGSTPDKARAKGGRISAGDQVLVGEEGPEVITARRSGYVHPNEDLQADETGAPANGRAGPAGRAGSAKPASVTVNAPITITAAPGESAEAIARRVRAELESQFSFSLRSALFDY